MQFVAAVRRRPKPPIDVADEPTAIEPPKERHGPRPHQTVLREGEADANVERVRRSRRVSLAGEVREESRCASNAPRGAYLEKKLDSWTDPGDARREPIVNGKRVTRLRLACRPALLLVPANVLLVHAEPIRKADAHGPAAPRCARTCEMGQKTSLGRPGVPPGGH